MGIRLLNIVPLAASPGMEWWKENFSDEYQDMLSSVPLGRVGDCETDIGRAVAWMCGPDAGYMTGSTIMLDGGQGWLR
jgi:NAD(P)-dependent dehydrogenase (short-subunit alcohol dehydrogenase family)